MQDRLQRTVIGLLEELGGATIPPFISETIRRGLTMTPPTDKDIGSTIEAIRARCAYIESGPLPTLDVTP